MATTAELRARLVEAEAAYHSLRLSGGIKTVVDQNGERVEYTAVNRASLAAYILELQHALGDAAPGPLKVFF